MASEKEQIPAVGKKITFVVHIQNNLDGSASPLIFPDEEAAQRFVEADQ